MKVKTGIILFFVLLSLGLSLYFLYNQVQQIKHKKEIYTTVPTFRLSDINGNVITESDLQKNIPTLFLFFNPDCELCREEMVEIQLHQDAFSICQMVFFSPVPASEMIYFLADIHFSPLSNMLFLADEDEDLTKKMEVRTAPASYSYNRKAQLIKRFNGPVKIETLIKYLSE